MRVSLIGKYGISELCNAFLAQGWECSPHSDEMILRDEMGRPATPGVLTPADLYLLIGEHGDAQKLPSWAHPLALWVIDPHFSPGLEWALGSASRADIVFVSQKQAVQDFRMHGRDSQWMPLACGDEPRPLAREEIYDVTFVGSLGPGTAEDRNRLCHIIQEEFPSHYIGTAWGEDLTRVYAQSRIVLNSSMVTTYRNLPPRVFHVLRAGKCLLTDPCNGLADLFEDGHHLVVYHDDNEFREEVRQLLADPRHLKEIAQSGHEYAMAHHTFHNRVDQILKACKDRHLITA